MRYREKKDSNQSIDISPLIDMVFILLIFFMVSTTFVKDMKVDIERPGASTATIASTKAIRVYIDRNREVFLEGQSVRPWILQSRVRELLESGMNQSVLVVTDKGVPAETLIEVVDQCRLAGAKDVGVATENQEGA